MLLNGGIESVKVPAIRNLQEQKKFPSLSTCRRWLAQYLTLGHIWPFKATGNRATQREITGEALYHLAFYRAIRPHARIYKVKAYLSNRFPNIRSYLDLKICRAEMRLGLSRKMASKTSKLAYKPENLQKRRNYWERPYPHGIVGERTDDVIDIDEAKYKLEYAD